MVKSLLGPERAGPGRTGIVSRSLGVESHSRLRLQLQMHDGKASPTLARNKRFKVSRDCHDFTVNLGLTMKNMKAMLRMA